MFKYYTGTGEGGAGGAGGSGGSGGSGGKIKIVTVDVPSGTTSVTLSIGSGGVGSTVDGQDGASGGATTMKLGSTTYSSADGEPSQGGFVNLLTGQLFGTKGSTGASGADGGAGVVGKTASSSDNFATGDTTAIGEPGVDIPPNTGGAGGTGNYTTGGNDSHGYVSGESVRQASKIIPVGGKLYSMGNPTLDRKTGIWSIPSPWQTVTVRKNSGISSMVWYEALNGGRTLRTYTAGPTIPTENGVTASVSDRTSKQTFGIAWGKGLGGAGGGGAAVSNDGGAASVNTGGTGANGTKPSVPTTRGAGGTGGSGGGGGGGGGGSLLLTQDTITTSYTCDGGTGGVGGSGGPGGNGAPGCAIIYY